MLMRAPESCFLMVDVQERLTPVMAEPRRVIRNCGLLLRIAGQLAVPVVASEQYPRGLGPTMVDLRPFLPPEGAAAKLTFSCADDAEIMRRITATGRRQIVIAGIEAHICVLQSALGLAAMGFQVFVVSDACSSRRAEDQRLAEQRLTQARIPIVSLEMALFEWLRVAGTEEFRELSKLIR